MLMRRIITFLIVFFLVQQGFAQGSSSWLVGVEGNTQGVGLELSMGASAESKWSYRLSYQYFRYLKENTLVLEKGSELIVNPAIRQQALIAKVDWHPFRKGRFRLTTGVAYHVIQDYKVLARSITGIKQGDITIAPEDFGVIDAALQWNKVRPYLGLGWGRAFPNHRISFGVDMGVYYMGSPHLNVNYEGFLETTTLDEELKKVEQKAAGYAYYPHLGFQIRYLIE